MTYNSARALALLRLGTQRIDSTFREDQEDAIRYVVEGRGRLLVVQKTGWGKSAVYFIATKLLREQGLGPVILISPLLSLMRNQVDAAKRIGVRAATIHSKNSDEWERVKVSLQQGQVDILLITPEKWASEDFRSEYLGEVMGRISMLVVDEAHCISDWGHDFRPDYRYIERIVRGLPPNLRLLATTATANQRVMDDLQEILGPNLAVTRGELGRPTLFLQTIRLPGQAERLAWLAEQLPKISGSGIIYTLTIRDAHQVCDWLQQQGINAKPYSGQADDRPQLETALLQNQVKALVSTTALGMGFDKPDLAFVIHYQMPGSVVGYYQQVGRAGRNIEVAYGILLSGDEEDEINDYFIESAFPERDEVTQIIAALELSEHGLSIYELMNEVNVSKNRIETALELMKIEVPSAVVYQDKKWVLTPALLSEEFWNRSERLTALRRAEQKQMKEYVELESGHMEFLMSALDSSPAGYRPPAISPLSTFVSPSLRQKALMFLKRTGLPLASRKQWPAGGLPLTGVRGRIPLELQAQEGRILCIWRDAGWGYEVRHGKYHNGRFSDDLVAASVEMCRGWSVHNPPTWVTCVPSLRHPNLVPDFARRLASALGLPFSDALVKAVERPAQKSMANPSQQARNIDGSLVVNAQAVYNGPVLLVDDMVDSGWTLTMAAYLLRSHGSGPVFPLALASTKHAE